MQRSTLVVDLLHIVFNWVQQRWWSGLWAYMVLDNVLHAFGLVSHDILRSVLLSASVHPTLTQLILYAVQYLTLHMGGHHGCPLIPCHV